jgi:hypothetical protein
MSLKKAFLLFTLSVCFQLNAQNYSGVSAPFISKSYDAFQAGESLKFRIHYGIFNASYATLDLKEEILDDLKIYKATCYWKNYWDRKIFF